MSDAELEAQIRARDAEVIFFGPGVLLGCQGDRRTLLRLLDEARQRINILVAESRAANAKAAAIRAAEKVNYRSLNASQIQIATLAKERDEARAELAHRDKLDEFTKPLSCEVHGLVPNLASFGNNCPNCQMMLLSNRCAKFAARITKADAEIERLREALNHVANGLRGAAYGGNAQARALRDIAQLALAPPLSET